MPRTTRVAGQHPPCDRSDKVDLDARDLRILDLLARNASRDTIAQELVCSLTTVERTIADLRHKLGAKTTIEAVVRAVRAGLI